MMTLRPASSTAAKLNGDELLAERNGGRYRSERRDRFQGAETRTRYGLSALHHQKLSGRRGGRFVLAARRRRLRVSRFRGLPQSAIAPTPNCLAGESAVFNKRFAGEGLRGWGAPQL